MNEELTPRLAQILEAVIERYVSSGRPVGSKFLFSSGGFSLAPSTLRSELSRLERGGYLDHPHTSAGRVPTDKGYRFYVDNTSRRRQQLLAQQAGAERLEGELEEALSRAASILARSTGLLAMISAPSHDSAAVKHVEVLRLHPDLVMIVVITASGGIIKKLILFDLPVDRGLVDWARGFLNDAVCGLEIGSRRLRMTLENSDLTPAESAFVAAIAPAFAGPHSGDGLYVDGVSRLFTRLEEDGSLQVRRLMELLDRQDEVLGLLQAARNEQNVYLRIGRELPRAAMQECSLVAANYGVGHRNLGTVGVLGPTRMDYPAVIGTVRRTAWSLSRFVEEIYQ